jgi:acyl carrier protein
LDRIGSVRDFIIKNFLIGDTSKLPSNSTSFLNNGIVDSTGMLEVINFLEETFGIKIEDSELLPENLDSLENIDRFVGKKMEAIQAKA